MVCLNCLNELTIVFRLVWFGVGTNLRPFASIDVSGGSNSWWVRLTMRLLLV